jgi:hypothetical protein
MISVTIADPGEQVMRDGPPPRAAEQPARVLPANAPPAHDAPPGPSTVRLAAARGEAELAQLVLRAETPVDGVRVEVTDLVRVESPERIAAAEIELLRQHYVHVAEPTTPAFSLGWYPDALPPLAGPLALEPGRNQSVWLKLRIAERQRPGTYRGEVVVTGPDGETVRVPVELVVWDLVLPAGGSSRSAFAIWYDQVAAHYGVEEGSPQALELARRFYAFQLDQRLPPDDLPLPPGLGADAWLEAAEPFLADPRAICFRIPFDAREVERTRAIVAGLRARGHLERGYFYLDEIDEPTAGGHEPTEGGHDRVRELCDLLEEIAPGTPHLVTAEPVPDLAGAVRTWCPLLDRADTPYARERRAAGDVFWWYGCIFPTHPYPSYHLDDDLAGARLLPWMMRRDGIAGNLYWATTIFRRWDGSQFVARDPWTDPVPWPGADGRGGGANGDGQLIYPGPGGQPVSTLRLEAIREGLEDHEHLVLLEQALAAAAERLGVAGFDPADVLAGYYDALFASVSDFTHDPVRIAAVRVAVAEHTMRLRDPAAPLVVARRLDAARCRVEVHAAAGASVTVEGRELVLASAAGGGDSAGAGAEDASVRGTLELPVPPDGVVRVVAERDGRRVEHPCFVPAWRDREPRVAVAPLPTAAPWTAANGTLRLDGETARFDSEPSGEDRPRLRCALDPARAGLADDTAVEVDVANEGERSIALYVRFEDRDGRAHDAARAMVLAGAHETVRVPLRLALLDPAAIVAFEVGVMPQQPAARLSLSRPRIARPEPADG